MAEINATFVVDAIDLTVVQEDPGITFTPDPINLNVYAAGFAPPGGENLTIQFNDNGKLGGAPNTAVSNGNITFGNVGNVKITGGTNGYFLQTDGSGNLTWAQGTANVSGNGTASGANGLIQLSDGTGNFTSGSGFSFDTGTNALAVPGDVVSAGDFNGIDANLSGNITAVDANLSGNITAVDANFSGNLEVAGTFAIGTLNVTDLTATGNIDSTSGIFNGDGYGLSNIPAANIVGLSLSSISNGTSNVNIPVADGNVIVNVGAQPNRFIISTVGANVEGNLGVTANVDADNLNANLVTSVDANITANLDAYNLTANFISTPDLTVNSTLITLGTNAGTANTPAQGIAIGLGAGEANLGLDSIAIGARAGNANQANNSIILNATGANLTTSTANSFTVKPVRNANTANILFYDDTTGEITYDSAPATNEISNGTSNVVIASANGNVSFNINGIPNVTVITATSIETDQVNASYVSGNGYQITGVAYANITGTPTLGNVSSVNLDGNSANYLNGAGSWSAPDAVITTNNVALGANTTAASFYGVAIAGNASANAYGIAIGSSADAGQEAVAIGPSSTSAGTTPSVAIGKEANATGQESVAIGFQATANLLNGVAIGEKARAYANNAVVINATGANLSASTANAMYVKPVRSVLGGGLPAGFYQVAYNPTTGEFIYYS